MLVSLYKIEELYIRILGTTAFHVKAENEQFTAVGSPLCQNLHYENLRSSYLPEYVKKIASKRVVRAAQLCFILYSDGLKQLFYVSNYVNFCSVSAGRHQKSRIKLD